MKLFTYSTKLPAARRGVSKQNCAEANPPLLFVLRGIQAIKKKEKGVQIFIPGPFSF
jgi:hypothetical protein